MRLVTLTVVVQVPEKGFPDINDRLGSLEPVAVLGADLSLTNNPSTFHIQLSNQMHLCKNCQDRFSAITPKGLKLHQKICQSFLKHEAAANERRRSTAAAKNAIKRTKLKERKMRLGSAALGVQVRICDTSLLIAQ